MHTDHERCLEPNCVTGNAELQTSVFLKDDTFEWHVQKLVWFGRGRQSYLFLVFSMGTRLNSKKAHALSLSLSLTHTHTPSVEKSLSWYGGSWPGTLELGACSLSLGFWHLDILGLWPCSPHRQECSWDKEMWGPLRA